MSAIIGRGRYARATYPHSKVDGSGGIPSPSVLTLKPRGVASPPNQFTDWDSLYAQFLKTKGPVLIAFDSTLIPLGTIDLPVATYDMQGRGLWVASGLNSVEVAIPDGGVIRNLIGLNGDYGAFQLNTSSTSIEPLQFDNIPFASFDVTNGCSFLQTGSVAVMRVAAQQALFITLNGEINLNSFPGFAELVHLSDPTSVLALSVFSGFNFFNSLGRLISGVAGSVLGYLYDSSWPGNPANPNFAGTTNPPVAISRALFEVYSATAPANWVAPPPKDTNTAIDRLAAAFNSHFGPVP